MTCLKNNLAKGDGNVPSPSTFRMRQRLRKDSSRSCRSSLAEEGCEGEVLKDTKVCIIRKEDFRTLMREHPDILLKITEELSARLERMETMVQRLGSPDADARIITALLEFSRRYGTPHRDGKLITLPLSREGLANYIGVTRETISRKLHRLQEEGLIKLVGTTRTS